MEFLAAVLAIVALIFVLKMRKRMTELELRVATLSGGIQAAPQVSFDTPPATAQPFVATEIASAAPTERLDESAIDETIQEAPEPSPPPPPEPVAPGKSFEERFGASWVVWIGGLALAPGGIFLVQFSIEAGGGGARGGLLLPGGFSPALCPARGRGGPPTPPRAF